MKINLSTAKIQILALLFTFLVSATTLALIFFKIPPTDTRQIFAITTFFLSAFIAVTTIFTLINFTFAENRNFHLPLALRRGILLGLFTIGLLVLLHIGALTWWIALLLGIILSVFEYLITTNI